MTLPLPQLQHLLLDMFSTERDVPVETVKALDDDDWERIMDMVREHRLGPMLHWRLSRERRDLPIPEAIRTSLANTFKQTTLRSLVWQRELLLTHRILEQAGIPHVALKGAYLAPHAYPHPALRPMRDLDILVPKEKALSAFQVLIEGGLTRPEQYSAGSPESFLSRSKHLPPLRSPSGQVSVEIHARLFHPDSSSADTLDLSMDPDFWRRCIARPATGTTLLYASPTDLLLHLIIHSVYDHGFDNGPLVLCDLAYLLTTQEIDWPLFWRLADERDLNRGCMLALRMTERYFGSMNIAWPKDSAVEPSIIEKACLLSLRSFGDSGFVDLVVKARSYSTPLGVAKFILGKAFPPKDAIASMYPVSKKSPMIYLWYMANWWRLINVRLPRFFRSSRNESAMSETNQIAHLNRWLENSAD